MGFIHAAFMAFTGFFLGGGGLANTARRFWVGSFGRRSCESLESRAGVLAPLGHGGINEWIYMCDDHELVLGE